MSVMPPWSRQTATESRVQHPDVDPVRLSAACAAPGLPTGSDAARMMETDPRRTRGVERDSLLWSAGNLSEQSHSEADEGS